jgi:hypothetical protein
LDPNFGGNSLASRKSRKREISNISGCAPAILRPEKDVQLRFPSDKEENGMLKLAPKFAAIAVSVPAALLFVAAADRDAAAAGSKFPPTSSWAPPAEIATKASSAVKAPPAEHRSAAKSPLVWRPPAEIAAPNPAKSPHLAR